MKRRISIKIPFVLLACIAFKVALKAQDTTRFVKVLPLPTIKYAPETRMAYGAVALFNLKPYKDSQTRLSNASAEFTYTANKQIIVETDWNYFFNKEKWFSQGLLHYSKYPDLYFGIGPINSDTAEVEYSSNRIVLQANMLKGFNNGFFLGPLFRYTNYSNISQTSGKINYSNLMSNSSIGFGIEQLWDTRDNILTPQNGHYINTAVDYNIHSRGLDYKRIQIDLRVYKKLKPKLFWSNRFFTSHASVYSPFYDVPTAGGDEFVRGFRFGKYCNYSFATLQTELRTAVYKALGLSLFGGGSTLGNRSNQSELLWNLGAGVRIRVDKKEQTNLRFDYAIGSNNNSGFYVAFGESF